MGDQKLGLQAAERIFDAVDAAEVSPIDGLSKQGTVLSQRSLGIVCTYRMEHCTLYCVIIIIFNVDNK